MPNCLFYLTLKELINQSFLSLNSTRLLIERPSLLSLLAFGRSSPYPKVDNRVSLTPLSIKKSFTDLVLSSESFLLY